MVQLSKTARSLQDRDGNYFYTVDYNMKRQRGSRNRGLDIQVQFRVTFFLSLEGIIKITRVRRIPSLHFLGMETHDIVIEV